jgi:hypothetical protein
MLTSPINVTAYVVITNILIIVLRSVLHAADGGSPACGCMSRARAFSIPELLYKEKRTYDFKDRAVDAGGGRGTEKTSFVSLERKKTRHVCSFSRSLGVQLPTYPSFLSNNRGTQRCKEHIKRNGYCDGHTRACLGAYGSRSCRRGRVAHICRVLVCKSDAATRTGTIASTRVGCCCA